MCHKFQVFLAERGPNKLEDRTLECSVPRSVATLLASTLAPSTPLSKVDLD